MPLEPNGEAASMRLFDSAPGPDPMSASRSGKRIPALDGVRGIALLLVFVAHSWVIGHSPARVDGIATVFAHLGSTGVYLFFVLSGFLITGILMDAKGGNGYLRIFYLRRGLRIYPAYAVLLSFVFLVSSLMPETYRPPASAQSPICYVLFISNFCMAAASPPDFAAQPLGITWTLAIEEHYYLIWPALVLVLSRRGLVRACVLAISASLISRSILLAGGVNPFVVFIVTPSNFDLLACGSVLAVWAATPSGLSNMRRWAPVAAVAASVGLIGQVAKTHTWSEFDPFVQTVEHEMFALLFGSVVVLAISSRLAQTVLTSPVLVRLGKYSYGMYLFHRAIQLYLPADLIVGSVPDIAGSHLPGQFIYSLTLLLSSLAVALASWHLVEKRLLALKARAPYGPVVTPILADQTSWPGRSASEPE